MTEIDFAPAVARPEYLNQGTAIEQSRAVAEVQSMTVVAIQRPRNEQQATERMLRVCRMPELADKGIYAYPKGDKIVTDLSIHAAVELARCWGNFDHGLTELSRDDVFGQSQMLAFAVDLETNVRDSHTFLVVHKRTGSGKRLTDTRDIYELNTNDGSRRRRQAILRLLPFWYTELARKTLRETRDAMAVSEGKSLDEQFDAAVGWFATQFGVREDQLEFKLGAYRRRWTRDDLVDLRILRDSLMRREITVDEVFPAAKVTAEELAPEQSTVEAGVNGEPNASADPQPEPSESDDAEAQEQWQAGGDDADA